MGKISNKVIEYKKQKYISNKKSILSISLASILKLVLAIALFFTIMSFVVYAGDVIVQNGNIYVDAANKVGIGTTSPGYKLEVAAGSTAGLKVRSDAPQGLVIGNAADTNFYFMVRGDNGNVGIGTTNPTAEIGNTKLRVSGAGHVTVDNNFGFLSVNSTGNGIGAGVDTNTDDSLNLFAGGAEKVRITTAGNVGIGTTGPESPLHIQKANSGGLTTLFIDNSAISALNNAAAIRFAVDAGATVTNGGAEIRAVNANAGNGATDIFFTSYTGAANQDQMVIKSTGNVGIGTTSPGTKLDVAGIIRGENVYNQIWTTGTAGTYNLKIIFDTARSNGATPGVYDCVLRTNNGAHWTGRRFTASVNFYIASASYPHRFYNEVDVFAGPGGCSAGLTAFNIATGDFTFDPGNCFQSITLICNRLY